ncbi:unnamed protein product, partial [Rotaria sp. Silwood2]
KPITNDDGSTDWSFHQDEASIYETKSDTIKVIYNYIIKEETHIYITRQRINHFFCTHMKISYESKAVLF